jgi:hypothetical protein
MVSDEQIRELAYYLWQQEGCPDGKATEHYFRAKIMLEVQESEPPKPIETAPPQQAEISQQTPITRNKPARVRKPRSKKSS